MYTPDEVAGVVDIFGALTRAEIAEALSELAYRHGGEPPDGVVRESLAAFVLVSFERESERLVAPGPAAFPELPEGAEDLPHILDAEPRSVDRAAVARAAAERLRTEAVCAVTLGDRDHADTLLDVSYDLEAWGGPDLAGVRERLDSISDGTN